MQFLDACVYSEFGEWENCNCDIGWKIRKRTLNERETKDVALCAAEDLDYTSCCQECGGKICIPVEP